ncbi:MAG: hypothetical protein ACWA5W_10160 [Phycisphaerales bacterium]
MSVPSATNLNSFGINPTHLVTPDRVIVPMPQRASLPQRIPFHEMLSSLNAQHRMAERLEAPRGLVVTREPDRFDRLGDSTMSANPIATGSSACSSTCPSAGSSLWPKIGEVRPVEPTPKAIAKIEQVFQQKIPATGQLLDLFL